MKMNSDKDGDFLNPPASARAHTWWHWNNGNVGREGITADLEAFARAGLGGVQLFYASCTIPDGPVAFNSPEWHDLFRHASRECQRLGLEFCFHNCPGWSSSGGGRIDLSGVTNDFAGDIRAWGGHSAFHNYVRGKTGTLLIPQSAGSGLTINSFVVTNTVMLGHDMGLSNVVVRPGGVLFLDSQTNRWAYKFCSLTLTGTPSAAASVVRLSDILAVNPESGGLVTNRHGAGVLIQADRVDVGQFCSIEANGRGFYGPFGPGASAGNNGGSHGGRGARLTGTGVCYGVVSAPTALGSGGGSSTGGGSIKLVTTRLTHNGVISANADPANYNASGGSGGSVWVQCGELDGLGEFQANGSYSINEHPGGGGRISIILTNSTMTSLSLKSSAPGGSKNSNRKVAAAAGTVYFCNISNPPSSGTLRIENPDNTTVDPVWTELPPRITGTQEPLRGTVLQLSDTAHVGLTSDCFVKDLFMSEGSTLRLNGYTLRVDSYKHPDWGDEAWVVYDGGQIIWRGGTIITVR